MLEFFVKMKDLMSGGLASLASNARRSFSSVQTSINQTVSRNDALASSFDRVGNRARSSSTNIGGMARSLAAYISIGAALAFGGGAIKSAMDFGLKKESINVLAGDKGTGEKLTSGLTSLQNDTILGPEVFKNAQTMMGFGIGAEKVLPNLKMLGDVSMGNAERLGSLTLAFSQVQAAGKLTGQDLLQFINAGFNPLNEISKKTGRSLGDLKTMMEKGGISSGMVSQAFIDATSKGGLFYGMLDKLAETAGGKMQQLMGGFESLKIRIGEALMPVASMFMSIATFLMDHIEIVGGVAAAWATYSVVTKGAAIAQGILNVVMNANPIVLAITLIAGLIVWIVALGNKYKLWGENLGALWTMIKAFGNLAWLPFKQFGESAWYYVELLHLKILDFAENVIGTFAKVGNAIQLAMSGDFSGAKNALTATVVTGASKQIKDLQDGHAKNQQQYAAEYSQNVKAISDTADKIGFTKKGGSLTAAGIATAGKGNTSLGNTGSSDKKDSTASGIAGNGPRNITINMGKMFDSIIVNASSVDKGLDQIEEKVQQVFLRILNSGASMQ